MSVVRPFSVLSKDEIGPESKTGRFLSKAEILEFERGVFTPLSNSKFHPSAKAARQREFGKRKRRKNLEIGNGVGKQGRGNQPPGSPQTLRQPRKLVLQASPRPLCPDKKVFLVRLLRLS